MLRILIFGLLVGLTNAAQAADQWLVVHAGTLLAVPGQPPKSNQTVIIKNGRITEVRDGFAMPVLAEGGDMEVVDLSDRFVLPGLLDMHTHLTGEFDPRYKLKAVTESAADTVLQAAVYARRTLQAGFTTVRNLGAEPEVIFALRDAIKAGKTEGPRIIAAGNAISATGGHGDAHGFREDVLALFVADNTCDGADDCRRAVRAQIKRGADVIKITATGGVLSEVAAGTGQQLFDDELAAIVETAHGLGRKVAAHAHGVDGINAALRAGVDSVDHGTYSDAESFRLYKKNGAYMVPTMLAGVTVIAMAETSDFMPPKIREKALRTGRQHKQVVTAAHKAGVKIAYGTDSGVSKHGNNALEFGLLVAAGLSEMEAIVAATISAADLVGLSKEVGTIEPGKAADLVATANSPLDDITEMERIRFVMRNGIVYKKN